MYFSIWLNLWSIVVLRTQSSETKYSKGSWFSGWQINVVAQILKISHSSSYVHAQFTQYWECWITVVDQIRTIIPFLKGPSAARSVPKTLPELFVHFSDCSLFSASNQTLRIRRFHIQQERLRSWNQNWSAIVNWELKSAAEVPTSLKWFAFESPLPPFSTIVRFYEFPRIEILLLPSSVATTPA